MRVSSGVLKGRKIRFDRHQRHARPTSSKVKEAVFNILVKEIPGSRFLELYAGTGAVGLEALSRGAEKVFFVESNKRYTNNIKKALEESGCKERTTIATKKVLSFIEWAEGKNLFFDIIFLDPPYHTDEILNALSALGRSCILSQDGIVVAEHFTKRTLPEKFESLQKIRDYTYGDTVLSLYQKT